MQPMGHGSKLAYNYILSGPLTLRIFLTIDIAHTLVQFIPASLIKNHSIINGKRAAHWKKGCPLEKGLSMEKGFPSRH